MKCATYEIQAVKNIGGMHANGKQHRGRYNVEQTRVSGIKRG